MIILFFLSVWVQYHFLSRMLRQKYPPVSTWMAMALCYLAASYINRKLMLYTVIFQQILFLIIDIMVVFAFFEGKTGKKLMLVILMDGIMYTSNFIFLPGIHVLSRQSSSMLYRDRLYGLCDVLTILLGALLYDWVIRKYRNIQGEMTAGGILYLFVMTVFVKISVIYFAQSQMEMMIYSFSSMIISTLFSVTGLLLILFSIYYIDRRLVLLLMEQQNQIMESHLAAAVEAERRIAGFRHDFNNHMICLENLLETGHEKQAAEYLHAVNKSVNDGACGITTGNIYADALLREKSGLAAAEGIEMEIDMILPGENHLPPLDLCIILGNALDNALEACRDMKNNTRKPRIRVLSYIRRSCLMIEIHNTVSPGIRPGTKSLDLLKTTKDDKKGHGIGLSNIQAAAERCRGTLELSVSEGEFHFCIMMSLAAGVAE